VHGQHLRGGFRLRIQGGEQPFQQLAAVPHRHDGGDTHPLAAASRSKVGRTPGPARVPLDPLATADGETVLAIGASRPTGASAADQGVRPTTHSDFSPAPGVTISWGPVDIMKAMKRLFLLLSCSGALLLGTDLPT